MILTQSTQGSIYPTVVGPSLIAAVKSNDLHSVDKLLEKEQSSETLILALSAASKQNHRELINFMIGHPAYRAIVEGNDVNGNHIALEIAKQIDDATLRRETLDAIRKRISQNSNVIFERNLDAQLEKIRKTMGCEIAKMGEQEQPKLDSILWWTHQPEIEKAAVEAQCHALKEIMENKDKVAILCRWG